MASFERYYSAGLIQGASATTIHTSNASDSAKADIVIGMLLSNAGSSTATASAYIDGGGSTQIYLCKEISIPVGGSSEIIQGKIVLDNTDAVKAVCTSGKIDVWLSVLDDAQA